jgi:PAS domain S-box-containing protein
VTFNNEITAMSERVNRLFDDNVDAASHPVVEQLHQELMTSLEELQVANEELELKNLELSEALDRVASERQRSADVFAFAPQAYIETDLNGSVTHINEMGCELLQVSRRFLARKPLASFVLPDDRHLFRRELTRFRGDSTPCELRLRLCRRDGSVVDVELSAVKRERFAGTTVMWRLRDVADDLERSKRFTDLYEQLEAARGVAEVARVLMSERDAQQEIMARITSFAAFSTGAAVATVHLAAEPAMFHVDDDALRDLALVQAKRGDGPSFEAMRTNELVVVDDLETEERWPFLHEVSARLAIHGVIALPMRLDGECVGVLTVFGRVPEMFGANEIEVLHALAAQAAFATSNARLFKVTSDLSDNLGVALTTRAVIEQAKGVIMVREQCNADQAFEILKKQSQKFNVKVNVLAQRIVSSIGPDAPVS